MVESEFAPTLKNLID
jgi:arsenite-transporting ATPase